MKNWRRVLSNMYVKTDEAGKVEPLFKLDGKNWASVEHYYHANKFKKNNPDFYNVFSMDSKSVICKDPKMALGAGGKTGIVRQKDPETKEQRLFLEDQRMLLWMKTFLMIKIMRRLWKRANKQNMRMKIMNLERNVLLATKDAKLLHYIKVVLRRKKDLLQLYFMILCV